jgi:beta-glucanase (GH16 family)/O-antigen/teichoic acid export membrane protein
MAAAGKSTFVAPDNVVQGKIGALRRSRRLRWVGHPATYGIGAPTLSVLGAGTTLLAPKLLDPTAFGAFALLTVLFQLIGATDFGLSQLADKEIGASSCEHTRADRILCARWVIFGIVMAVTFPASALVPLIGIPLSPLDLALALTGGAAFMVANGPVTQHRAAHRLWEFTASALILQLGMTMPRLAGLLLGGVTGCFGTLAAWFGALALLHARPRSLPRVRLLALFRHSLPLFVFYGLWLLYQSANRWISAALSSAYDFGLFAFGATLCFVALGLLGAIAQIRYPRLLLNISEVGRFGASAAMEREGILTGSLLVASVGIGILVIDPVIHLVFPLYVAAIEATVALAISCVPLGFIAWTLPILISRSASPWTMGIKLFGPALLALTVAMVLGDRWAGIAGQGWGCVAASLALVLAYVALLHKVGVVSGAACVRLAFLETAFIAVLVGIAIVASASARLPNLQAASSAAPADWQVTFEEKFESLRLWNGAQGVWEPHYPWGARTNSANGERQYYVDPRPGRDSELLAGVNPYEIRDGVLVIRARPIAAEAITLTGGLPYASGLLTTVRSFSFTYGFVEMKARVPQGRGLWPAFWMAPADGSWPPEIDVMEVLGNRTQEYWASAHWGFPNAPAKAQHRITSTALSRDFHVYAVKWTSKEIVWYLDGRQVASMKTPSEINKPMYILVNLAVGGEWPGVPDSTTTFPAEYHVAWIRVLQPVP